MLPSDLLQDTAGYATGFLNDLLGRPVGATATAEELRSTLGGPLPDGATGPGDVVQALVKHAEPGVVAIPGGRYFGFVIGGALPAALAADWLTSVWDQNSGLFAAGPAASVVEEISGAWLAELLQLPSSSSFGFVTGCQMAHFTALAAARHHVLGARGWDVEANGLHGGPRIRVIVGQERHITVDRALRFLGLGSGNVEVVPADDQGRMELRPLAEALRGSDAATIVCAQAGNVNTGAFDPIGDICDVAHDAGAWVHVDGAFGLWANASPMTREHVGGVERADSWATDAHKMLNVPYDSGLVFCAHPDAHRAAMGAHASYLVHSTEGGRPDEMDWVPEFSRRARGFPVYAAIRSLGRSGIVDMVERFCLLARRFATGLARSPDVRVLNEVVFNQVLVRFMDEDGEHDARTRSIVSGVQQDGTCWLSGSTWQGNSVMRISVCNWSTTEEDVDRSVDAILRVAREA